MTKSKISGNYINSVFAKREALNAGYDEALMLDTDGYISEGTGENIFIVRNFKINTTTIQTAVPFYIHAMSIRSSFFQCLNQLTINIKNG